MAGRREWWASKGGGRAGSAPRSARSVSRSVSVYSLVSDVPTEED